jgi:lipooligosaccharide transport system permease protein
MRAPRALLVVEHNLVGYRRVWRGSVFSSLVSPMFFLAAMGIGLGTLVNRHSGGVGGVPYRDFIAPGLLATAAMQTASIEASYPILGKIKWDRIYESILQTPLGTADLLFGEVLWFLVRLLISACLFFVGMLVFGTVHSALGPLAILAAVGTGLAFGIPILAFTARVNRDSEFAAMQRFVITPLFLFGGAFFPITQLPQVLQWVAMVTPLYHGVVLARSFTLGTATLAGVTLHGGVLLAYTFVGVALAGITLRQRLVH